MTRPNPKRSGGPKTTGGKQVAAMNGLKIGAYSQSLVVLPGEDQQAFQELQSQFSRDFSPQDIAESAMVRDLAILAWKKMRLDRFENSAVLHELNRRFVDEEFFGDGDLLTAEEANAWVDYRLDPQGHPEMAEKMRQLAKKNISEALLHKLKVDDPVLYDHILPASELPKPRGFEDYLLLLDNSEPLPNLFRRCLERHLKIHQRLVALEVNPEAVDDRLRQIKERRLLLFLEARTGRRVQDDLDRAFYRTLNELRRHQSWRRAQSEINVTPASDDD